MGDWLKRKLTGIALAVVVLAAWWGYDRFIGGGGSAQPIDKTPTVVFGGGAGKLTLDINMNKAGYLATSFAHGKEDDEEDLHAHENLEAGEHFSP